MKFVCICGIGQTNLFKMYYLSFLLLHFKLKPKGNKTLLGVRSVDRLMKYHEMWICNDLKGSLNWKGNISLLVNMKKITAKLTTKLRGLSPRANCTYRVIPACRRSWCKRLLIKSAMLLAWLIPTPYSRISRPEPLLFFQVAPQLYSRVDPVPDPLLIRKSGRAWNQTRTSGSVASNSDY
jgi:hypothetical protein